MTMRCGLVLLKKTHLWLTKGGEADLHRRRSNQDSCCRNYCTCTGLLQRWGECTQSQLQQGLVGLYKQGARASVNGKLLRRALYVAVNWFNRIIFGRKWGISVCRVSDIKYEKFSPRITGLLPNMNSTRTGKRPMFKSSPSEDSGTCLNFNTKKELVMTFAEVIIEKK